MYSYKDTIEKVKNTIFRFGMTDSGDKVIVAVSGGPDSVCLLDILQSLSEEIGISLVVAHYDHGMRGKEDKEETQLVKNMAESMGIVFETGKAHHLKGNAASMEEKAREARYDFLEKVRKKHNACRIALGHNMNDQAETVIMRLLRGSGPSGLAGIPPIREDRIIRPLIEIKREEIESYLGEREISYAVDSSNKETVYLRNRIRIELIPLMLDYQPRLIEHLGGLSDILRDEDNYMESQAEGWAEKNIEKKPDESIHVRIDLFQELPDPLRNRVIRLLIMKAGKNLRHIDRDHVYSVSKLADNSNSQAMIDLPNGIIVRKVYDRMVFLSRAEKTVGEFNFVIKGPGTFYLEPLGRTVIFEEVKGKSDFEELDTEKTAFFDADKIPYPLTIRNSMPGDRFVPLGMKGQKKVKDFFIDRKIPSDTRKSIPILTCRDSIVWVCGYRIDDRFKITPVTKKILRVSII